MKGLRILSLFTEQRPTWRVTDVAAATDMPLPTAYRAVMTLTVENYLKRLPNGAYRPDARVLALGAAALRSLDLVEIATPRLQRLAEATGGTVSLAVLRGDRVLYLVRLRNSDLVTANIQVGSTRPAVHTSIGQLLLADLDDASLLEIITEASFAPSYGPNAEVSFDKLRRELAKVRRQGWATQDGELAFGLSTVAAPVRGPSGRVVAGADVAVQSRNWPIRRITRELKPTVARTCEEISSLIGDQGAT